MHVSHACRHAAHCILRERLVSCQLRTLYLSPPSPDPVRESIRHSVAVLPSVLRHLISVPV